MYLHVHAQTTWWSESIDTMVAFVTLLSADYVSENCRIIEELWSQVPLALPPNLPNLCSPVPGPVSQLLPTGPEDGQNPQIFAPAKKFQALEFPTLDFVTVTVVKKFIVDNQNSLTK